MQDTDKHSTGNLRSLVWGKLGVVGHEGMIKYSKEKMELMMADPNVSGISPDMKGNIILTCATVADSIDPFIKLHSAVSMEEEKRRVERSIGYFRKQELIEKAIDFAFRWDNQGCRARFINLSYSLVTLFVNKIWLLCLLTLPPGHLLVATLFGLPLLLSLIILKMSSKAAS